MIVNLFSTANLSSGRSEALERMLGSIREAASGPSEGPSVRLLLLLQCCDGVPPEIEEWRRTIEIRVLTVPGLVSLSVARNRLLAEGERLGWMVGDEIVAFPDDDCWYPAGALRYVHDAFTASVELDFWFCDYASRPVPMDAAAERDASVHDVLRRASSNTIFFRSAVVRGIGAFDPELGVGARLNGSEDTDYALRAFVLSRRTRFMNRPSIGHRDRNPAIRAKYYPSGLLVVARHARSLAQLRMALVRKLAVGCALVARGELEPRAFGHALRIAAREMNGNRRGRKAPRSA